MASAENQKSVWASRYVKVLTHDRIPKVEPDFAICLPPKTGSTHWQDGLIGKFYPKEFTRFKEGHADGFYEVLPRLKQKQDLDGAILILNARNPILRMASGWKNKMQTGRGQYFDNYWAPFVNEISQITPDQPPSGYKVSLTAFSQYILKKSNLEPHFATQSSLCQLVNIFLHSIIVRA